MDYEWFYRITKSKRKGLKYIFHKYPIAEFILGGKSSDILLACKEHFFLYKKYENNLINSFLKASNLYFKKLIYYVYELPVNHVKRLKGVKLYILSKLFAFLTLTIGRTL